MNKPTSIKVQELKDELSNIINSCELDPTIVRYVVNEFKDEVEKQYYSITRQDLVYWDCVRGSKDGETISSANK